MTFNPELKTKQNNPAEWKDVMPRNGRSLVVQMSYFLSNFFDLSSTAFELSVSLLLCANADSGCFWFVVQNWRIPPQNGNLLFRTEALHGIIILSLPVEQIERSVLRICSQSKLICLFISPLVPLRPSVDLQPPSNSFILSFPLTMPAAIQNTTLEGVSSKCWCSLTLTLATSIGIWHSAGVTKGVTSPAAHCGIWHGAGATKSWSSVVSLFCSWRISLCIQSNYDSGGWATRVIHFSVLVFTTVFITLIRQETISLAIRNYSFWHPIEGRLTFRERLNLLQSTVYKIHSLAKSKALAVSESSQTHLPNNSKCMRQETVIVTSIDIL